LVATGGVCPSCASPEDEEFNRVEMESRIKQEYIRAMNDKPDMDNYIKLMEELSIARMLIRELGDRLARLEKTEPVACAECGANGGHALYCVRCAEVALNTWVGLTDEETRGCIEATIEITDPLLLDAVNAVIVDVERLLREKNT